MLETKSTRRQFLTSSAALTTAAASAQTGRIIGANDRINVGVIGVGIRGMGHVRTIMQRAEMKGDVRLAAISDIYARRTEAARQAARLEAKDVHRDYRELLARADIDAVFIVTPDHWHAKMAIEAMERGKDVYLEKPMTLTIEEARQIAEKVKQTGRVLQVGSQHLSDKRYHRAREVVEKGWIGEVLWAQTTYSRNSVWGEWNYRIDEGVTAEEVGWKDFLGPAPERPFDPDRYFRWRKYWDYSGGIATDLFYHRLAPLRFIMGIEFPTRVTGAGGIYVHKDREVPDTYATIVEYANNYCIISSSMANAAANRYLQPVIYGHKGTITFDDNVVIVEPEWQFEREFVEKAGSSKVYLEVPPHNMDWEHVDNFLTCMRTRQKPVFDADFGYKIMAAIKLGVDSYREGKLMLWDPDRERLLSQAPPRPAYAGDGKNREEPRPPFRFRGV